MKKIPHASAAAQFLKDEDRVDWHSKAIWNFRKKRDLCISDIPEWEQLRELASQIKDHTLSNLDTYLLQFERNALQHGVKVHWAATGEDHNRIVHGILERNNIKRMVKSKSMLTEECHLNPYLEARGIEVTDTDLGERIIQMREEPPSHIVAPAIHIKKEEVSDLFHEKLDTEKGNSDPKYLTEAARQHLRNRFLTAGAALTGVNFAIAETGSIVVCTNEGNADMGVHCAPVQIHCMGIEKIIPRLEHLGIFTRLLARNSTGQPITIYTSHYQHAKPEGEMHVVIVDNGRSAHLGRSDFRSALKCIRCGACLNTCPVYRKSGGYSYGSTVAGPIGSILTPGKDLKKFRDLPFASSLCGSCSDVCPVKIDIHQQLYKWRQIVGEQEMLSRTKKTSLAIAGKVLANPKLFDWAGKMARSALKLLPRFVIYNPLNGWGKFRELPDPPAQSFKDWYKQNR